MPATIATIPKDWVPDVDTTFRLKSNSLLSAGFNAGAADVYGPLAQVWVASIPIAKERRREWQRIGAFFSRAAGVAGLVRMHDPKRIRPGRDMVAAVPEAWGDGTFFSDGTGWASGSLIPPYVALYEPAGAGDDSIVLTGLPASEAPCLWAGDLVEFRPSGIPAAHGMLHEVSFDAPTDANGRTRAYISPSLRKGLAAGDMAVLSMARSVFRAIDDDQGILAHSLGGIASAGFSLIEVLPS